MKEFVFNIALIITIVFVIPIATVMMLWMLLADSVSEAFRKRFEKDTDE